MLERIIEASIRNRALVLLLTAFVVGAGIYATERIPLDAIPDLSDVQVILFTEYPGQSPDVVEDQVTYPLTTTMLAVPYAKVVRGYSFFGFSMVYVIFEDGTDLYWARSRTLEALSFVQGRLPTGVTPQIGPDATGVGWVYQYALMDYGPHAEALRGALDADHDEVVSAEEAARGAGEGLDRAGFAKLLPLTPGWDHEEVVAFTFDDFDADLDGRLSAEELREAANFEGVPLDELRSLQDWFLRYELTPIEGVAEVASLGGYVKQYQVEVDPDRLDAHGISIQQVRDAVKRSNDAVGGRLVEMAETEYMVRALDYVDALEDLESVVLKVDEDAHVPVLLEDVANVHLGPDIRRGIADWGGKGDVVAGIVVMRFGDNALEVIERVKARLAALKPSLPKGVRIVPAYDRSALIHRAIETLQTKLGEEMLVVALICLLFLLHFRSALVAIFVLPVGVLVAFIVMHLLGINANTMSLGGIAIAVGVMVDASVVMVENLHKHLERNPGGDRQQLVLTAAKEVGPALFYSLLIITVSFLPVFALEAQEGRMFSPLAYTKTFSMAAASVLAITVIPVLMFYLVRGRIRPEAKNPLSRLFIRAYRPVIAGVLRYKKTTIAAAGLALAVTAVPYARLGSEFMPPLDEGDLLYMPTTLPGVSITKAKELLQQTDRIIGSFPEVHHVFGKIGRAETATDPAPLSMIETTIMLHPDRARWRKKRIDRWYSSWAPDALRPALGTIWPEKVPITIEDLIEDLDEAVQFPGLTNAWTMPIKTRIDMLATGIKTPVGIKLLGPDLEVLTKIGQRIEGVLDEVPGTLSVYSERVTGGNFMDFDIDRTEIARYGLKVSDVQDVIRSAIGGMNVSTTVEGLARYPINVRYSPERRSDIESLRRILVATPMGHSVPLGQLADIRLSKAPPSIKSENARRTAWIYVDLEGVDVGTYVERAKQVVAEQVSLPPGVSLKWSGQYEYMARAAERLSILVPLTLLIVLLLLYLHFKNLSETLIVLLSLPFALVGGVWLMYLLDYDLSVAVAVGFIALAGLAAETGVVMLVYLDEAVRRRRASGELRTPADLAAAIEEGAVERVRPKLMTVATTLIGLLPVMFGTETGAQIMKRIAAPMVGGLISSTVLTLVIIPAVYMIVKIPGLRARAGEESEPSP